MSVVLFHAAAGGHLNRLLGVMPDWFGAAIMHGDLGVAIFFALSGFVIAHSLGKRKMDLGEFGRFTLRRSLRLDPPYWAALVTVMVYSTLSSLLLPGREPVGYSVPQVIAHVVYLQDLLGYPPIGGVFWTLCLEIQFYLIYALLLFLPGRSGLWFWAACAFSALWPLNLGPAVSPGVFLPLWHAFLIGAAAYWGWRQASARIPFILFAAALLYAAWPQSNNFTMTATLTAILLFGLGLSDRLSTSLNWRWLQFLGLISYSLYLTHNIATGAVFRIGVMLGGASATTELFWWIASVSASIVLAFAFWRIIERPSQQLSKKGLLRRKPADAKTASS